MFGQIPRWIYVWKWVSDRKGYFSNGDNTGKNFFTCSGAPLKNVFFIFNIYWHSFALWITFWFLYLFLKIDRRYWWYIPYFLRVTNTVLFPTVGFTENFSSPAMSTRPPLASGLAVNTIFSGACTLFALNLPHIRTRSPPGTEWVKNEYLRTWKLNEGPARTFSKVLTSWGRSGILYNQYRTFSCLIFDKSPQLETLK